MSTYLDQRRTPELQRCLKLRKLAEQQSRTTTATINLPPFPVAILPCPPDPPPSYGNHNQSTHAEKVKALSHDPSQISMARQRALADAQDLIGKIMNDDQHQPPSPTTTTKDKTKSIDSQNTAFQSVTPQTKPQSEPQKSLQFKTPITEPLLVASTIMTPTSPLAELPMLIASIINTAVPTPGPSVFQFHLNQEAAIHNALVLRRYDFDLERAITADGSSPLKYGSEFRPKSILAPLLSQHPNWKYMGELFDDGCSFIAPELSETDRQRQLELALIFGNHKGASQKQEQMQKLLNDDVIHGYNLPVPCDLIQKIKGLVLSPMNIARQNTIDETGRVIEKDRLTHDHTYEMFPGSSINKRCRLDLHQTCMFGKALSRMIHWIVEMRTRYPLLRILLTKTDWKAAYRRAHLNLRTAVQCATHTEEFLLIPLRMTFGGAPCPASWSCISDTACDLATDLSNHPNWEPRKLHSPHQHLLPEVKAAPTNRDPPHPAKELLFSFPPEEDDHVIKFDNYIDDLLGGGVEVDNDAVDRLSAAGSLVLHTLGRPVAKDEPIPRDDLNSLKKLAAEGLPEEEKICLGIHLDTYRLLASLPKHKYKAWSDTIRKFLLAKKINFQNLEELIGRLEHVNLIQPPGRHFLGRLRCLHASFSLHRHGYRHLSKEVFKDLELWLKLLKRATTGVSLNLLVHRNPTHVYRTDACLHGLGGYSDRGRAWRFEFPEELLGRASINLLEYIGTLVSPWLDFVEGQMGPEASILSESDNATASAWCHKSNFESIQRPTHLKVSRRYACFLLEAKAQLVNEWLAGVDNKIADSLSRDTHLSPDTHEKLLLEYFPSQIPNGFRIKPLPAEINSWICSILQSLPEPAVINHRRTRSELVSGIDGSPIWPASVEKTILTCSNLIAPSRPPRSSQSLSGDLLKPFDLVNCSKEERKAWLVTQSEVTWTAWYRPSGLLGNQTPHSIQMESFRRFYRGSSPVTKV
jgi:hypothetical protein